MKPPICRSTTSAPAVCKVTVVPFASATCWPLTCVRSSPSVGAMRSMMFSLSACSAVMLVASVTNVTARSALRPLVSARLRIRAAASLMAFSEPVAPLMPTGVAAPTFVPGAMAAIGQDIRT